MVWSSVAWHKDTARFSWISILFINLTSGWGVGHFLLFCTGEAMAGHWDQFGAPRHLQSKASLGIPWRVYSSQGKQREAVEAQFPQRGGAKGGSNGLSFCSETSWGHLGWALLRGAHLHHGKPQLVPRK